MKILILTSERPPVTSGIARSVDQLRSGLMARGHDVDVLAAVDFPRLIAGEVRLAGLMRHWPRIAPTLPSYDVINVHGPVPTVSDLALAGVRTLPRSLRPAIVYTHHSNIELQGAKTLSGVYSAFHERLAAKADHVVVSTTAYQTQLAARGIRRCSVVPWGVDLDRFATAADRVYRSDPVLRAVFVGQMRPYKGVPELIAAVLGSHRVVLDVVGAGPHLDEYRQAAATAPNITFHGRVSDDELARIYAQAEAVVLPSTTTAEAFGIVLLEGMAAGCVPVASDLPGVRDLAGPSGVLVAPGDVQALREALEDLADDPVKRRALQSASAHRSREFSTGSVAARYEAIMVDAVHGVRRSRTRIRLGARWDDPEGVLRRVRTDAVADSAALLVYDLNGDLRLRDAWVDGSATPVHASGGTLARRTARIETSLIGAHPAAQDSLTWRAEAGASELYVPVSSGTGTAAVLCLRRTEDFARAWSYADVPHVYASVVGSDPESASPQRRFDAAV